MFDVFLLKSWTVESKVTLFLVILITNILPAQNSSNRFFYTGVEIEVDNLPENNVFYSHVYDNSVTIYSLAEVFQVSKDVLFRESNIDPNKPIHAGKIVKVRLDNKRITVTKPRSEKYFVLIYRVKPSETLYSISKKFKNSVNAIQVLNNKTTSSVQSGEAIKVGYYLPLLNTNTTTKTPKKTIEKFEEKNSKTDVDIKNTDPEDVTITKYYLSDVIGFYDKTAAESANYFVLFDDARPGSMIDIYNPMVRRHIKAKVIGKIPQNTYNSDVSIIISPSIAKGLGIFDTRFKVNIKYEK